MGKKSKSKRNNSKRHGGRKPTFAHNNSSGSHAQTPNVRIPGMISSDGNKITISSLPSGSAPPPNSVVSLAKDPHTQKWKTQLHCQGDFGAGDRDMMEVLLDQSPEDFRLLWEGGRPQTVGFVGPSGWTQDRTYAYLKSLAERFLEGGEKKAAGTTSSGSNDETSFISSAALRMPLPLLVLGDFGNQDMEIMNLVKVAYPDDFESLLEGKPIDMEYTGPSEWTKKQIYEYLRDLAVAVKFPEIVQYIKETSQNQISPPAKAPSDGNAATPLGHMSTWNAVESIAATTRDDSSETREYVNALKVKAGDNVAANVATKTKTKARPPYRIKGGFCEEDLTMMERFRHELPFSFLGLSTHGESSKTWTVPRSWSDLEAHDYLIALAKRLEMVRPPSEKFIRATHNLAKLSRIINRNRATDDTTTTTAAASNTATSSSAASTPTTAADTLRFKGGYCSDDVDIMKWIRKETPIRFLSMLKCKALPDTTQTSYELIDYPDTWSDAFTICY